MGGGKKKELQNKSEQTSAAAAQLERERATQLSSDLTKRRDLIGTATATDRAGAQNLRDTGGFDTSKTDMSGVINPIRAGYTDLAATGGFSTGDRENFLRKSAAPVAAMYSRGKDELNRRLAVQGGYSPGFDAATARLTRQGASAGADASLNANVDLASQIRAGKTAGLSGQMTLAGTEQTGKIETERAVQTGRIAGQDALQRVTQFGIAALSDVDQTELRNRLQSGQMSQADAQLLTMLASQNKSLFDKIMQGVGTIGGAVAGVAGAMG